MSAAHTMGDIPSKPATTSQDSQAERPFVARTRQWDDGDESLDVWGFADTRFEVDAQGVVTLSGKRYALCGQPLPYLLPWVEKTMAITVPLAGQLKNTYPPRIAASRVSPQSIEALEGIVGREHVSVDDRVRLRRGHGHTQEEMFALKHGGALRAPDAVVFPDSESEVEALVACAKKESLRLLPYGGGTNVTQALKIETDDDRPVVAVDMQRMDRILWLDPVNRMVAVEAGAVGRHLQKALAERGLTLGHEPDSIEFSTVGGWVATHASGMKKNRYGNIEDLLLDLRVVTADGVLHRPHGAPAPRESIGSDAKWALLGSEGSLGIITSAVFKISPLPEQQTYGSLLFPSFEDGVQFLYKLQQTDSVPASVRLVDNTQFQLSMALKSPREGLAKIKSQVEKWAVTRLRGFDPERMVACTLVFEGDASTVSRQKATVMRLASAHRGMWGGADNGAKGYQLTYGIAYIRDFVMKHYILAESFETSVPWRGVLELCERVKRRIAREHAARSLPGKPLVTCRVTQLYDTGVAVYFYFAYFFRGVEQPDRVYHDIEAAARDEILAAGGSLSHHHGVGHLRRKFLPRIESEAAGHWRQNVKKAHDSAHLFGSGSGAVH